MAHTHHCSFINKEAVLLNGKILYPAILCGEVVAVHDRGDCYGNDEGHYCSRHHPDPRFHGEDPPQARMNVRVIP